MSNDLAIAFVDMSLSLDSIFSAKAKLILSELNGGFEFGTISALMGSSGSGKTTLLKCLSGSNKYRFSESTKVYTNSGQKIRSCFINQDQNDRVLKGLTVKQSLTYASKLKNSCESGVAVNHSAIVSVLMSELMISDVCDNRVDNCSGGQIKRLAIAMELTAVLMPNLMFIDEPTTGLDSNGADIVISCLKSLSRRHSIAIIASIHQPNNELFMQFDSIYVLAKEGRHIYWGRPQHLKQHLHESGIECNEDQVPIEVLLKYSSKPVTDKYVKRLCDKTHELCPKLVDSCLENEMLLTENFIRNKTKMFSFKDFWYLLLRTSTLTYVSQWKALLYQMLFYSILLICLTFAYNRKIGKIDGCFSFDSYNTDYTCDQIEDQMSIIEQNLYLQYIGSISTLTIHTAISTSSFLTEMKIFSAEHQNNWYSTGSYYWAKSILEQISSIIYAYIYTIIMYVISGQPREVHRFYKFLYISLMGFMCTQTLGSIIGILVHRNHRLALAMAIGIYSVLHYFNNFIVQTKDLFPMFQTISDFVFPKYLFNSYLLTIYGFERCAEEESNLVLFQYGVEDDDLFWTYSRHLLYSYLCLKVFEFLFLILKANKISLKIKLKFFDNNSKESVDLESNCEEAVDLIESTVNRKGSEVFELKSEHKLIIAWIDMTLEIRPKLFAKKQIILNKINGFIEFESFNGLLGPSGAGKTSLLQCLNGRQTTDLSPETKIFLNSSEKINSCFITQHISEHLLNGLTAKQTLIYASKLKNSVNGVKGVANNQTIDELMDELMISSISDTLVEHCSGGERKRLAIASELTSYIKPNLLCIDEPTSGLDSEVAEGVIQCLKSLTRKHRISIIASIHQPNNELLSMFDTIHVLAKGGLGIYCGPPEHLKQQLIHCNLLCNEYQAPIENLLKHSAQGVTDSYIEEMHKQQSPFRLSLLANCADNDMFVTTTGLQTKSKAFLLIDFWYLLLRTMKISYLSQWKSQFIQILIVIAISFPFSRSLNQNIAKPDSCIALNSTSALSCFESFDKFFEESLISQNIKYHLVFITGITFLQIVMTPLTFTSDVKIFINEQRNGWYSSGAYYWAKTTVDMIPVLVTLIPYCHIMNKYHTFSKYLSFLSLVSLCTLCSQTIGHISGIIFNTDSKTALITSFAIHNSVMILGNIIIPLKEFHLFIQYFGHISYIKHTFEDILLIIYGFDRCPTGKGSSVLHRFDIDNNIFWVNVQNLILVFVGLKFIALLLLILKTNLHPLKQFKRKQSNCNFDAINDSNVETFRLNDFNNGSEKNQKHFVTKRKVFYV